MIPNLILKCGAKVHYILYSIRATKNLIILELFDLLIINIKIVIH